jgi:hypothetical protein
MMKQFFGEKKQIIMKSWSTNCGTNLPKMSEDNFVKNLAEAFKD